MSQYQIDVLIFFGAFAAMFGLAGILGTVHGWLQTHRSSQMKELAAKVALARLAEQDRQVWR